MAVAAEPRSYDYCAKNAVDDWPPTSPAMTVTSMRFGALESLPLDEALFEPVSSLTAEPFAVYAMPDSNFAFVGDEEFDRFFAKCSPVDCSKHETTSIPSDEPFCTDTAHSVGVNATEKAKDFSENPTLWTADECVRWLMTTCAQFRLPACVPAAYRKHVAAGGCGLLAMSLADFCSCLGEQAGNLLYAQLRLWITAFESTQSSSKKCYSSGYNGMSFDISNGATDHCEATTSSGGNTQVIVPDFWNQNGESSHFASSFKEVELSSNSSCISAENEVADDESFGEISDDFYGLISGSSQPQHQLLTNDNQTQQCQDQSQQQKIFFGCDEMYHSQMLSHLKTTAEHHNYYVREPSNELCNQSTYGRFGAGRCLPATAPSVAPPSGTIHLWHFIRELLDQPLEYGSCVRWVNRNEGTFKIESSQNLAQIWGQRKNRSAMNYDKLSRSLRQYYKKGIIQKPEKKQRLVYRFLPPYNL